MRDRLWERDGKRERLRESRRGKRSWQFVNYGPKERSKLLQLPLASVANGDDILAKLLHNIVYNIVIVVVAVASFVVLCAKSEIRHFCCAVRIKINIEIDNGNGKFG